MAAVLQIFMKKNWILLVILAVMAVIYVHFFTDWFKPKTLQIYHITREPNQRFLRGQALSSLRFVLDQPTKLTEIELVSLAEYETNRNVLPLWHLVSPSNSVPVKTFYYGQYLRGLKAAVPGSRAQPLTNDVTYRLIVTAGSAKGQHDFKIK